MAVNVNSKKIHHLPPREVAQELTLMDAELLRRIQPSELEDGAWMDKTKKNELAPNVMAMVQSFNRLALLVPTEILEERTPQTRSKVIATFIQVASKCYHLRNYNSLKAILAGLQCTPIYRLDKTWKEVPSKRRKKFLSLSALMSEESNFNLYHQDLEQTLAANTPCIPFLGIFLTVVVQHDSYAQMSSKKMRRQSTLLETYTILDAITVRNTLEKLRQCSSSIDSYSPPTSPVLLDSDRSSEDSHSPPVSPVLRDIETSSEITPSGAVQNGVMNGNINLSIPESAMQNENVPPKNGLRIDYPYHNTKPARAPVLKQLGKKQAVNLDPPAASVSTAPVSSVSKSPSCNFPSELKSKALLMSRSLGCLMDACLNEANPADKEICPTHMSSSLTNLESHCNGDSNFLQGSATSDLLSPAWVVSDYCAEPTHSLPLMSAAPKLCLRKRRTTPDVWRLHVSQADRSSSPLDLLERYQFLSLGRYVQMTSKPELRAMLSGYPHNTEGQNYRLSYEREPQSV